MKIVKLFSLSAVAMGVLISNNGNAQITVTQADFAVVGDIITNAYDTIPPALSVGGTGSQTWDFSSLQIDYFDSNIYIDPSTTVNAADFPGANLAVEMNGFTAYILSSATEVAFEGFAGDLFGNSNVTSVPFNPTQVVQVFPSTDGTGFTDTSAYSLTFAGSDVGEQVDSIGVKHTSYLTATIDAYGTMITPAGTYQVLRQYSMEVGIDSIKYKDAIFTLGQWVFLDPVYDTTYNYTWLANGEGYPVVEMETDAPGGNILSVNFKVGAGLIAYVSSSTGVSCNGDCDGWATAQAISGVSPYTYLWDDTNTQTTITATGLCPGSYMVTIVDTLNDSSSAYVTIAEPDSLLASLTTTDIKCKGDGNGMIKATTTGGTMPYTYSWSSGGSSSSEFGLVPGTHFVTITDVRGCMLSDSGTVTEPTTLMAISVSSTIASCDTCMDGTATATVTGGDAPYMYSWNDPGSQTTASATGLNPGTYQVIVTDSNGCIKAVIDTVDLVGIYEINPSHLYFNVFPNPTSGLVKIETDAEVQYVQLLNLMGEEVLSVEYSDNFQLNTSHLPDGLYIIRLVGEEYVLTRKLQKVR